MSQDGVIKFCQRGEPTGNPPAGCYYVWLDSTEGKLRQKDSSGTVYDFRGPEGTPVVMAAMQADRAATLALTTTAQTVMFDSPTSVETNIDVIEHDATNTERVNLKEASNYSGVLSLLVDNTDIVSRDVTLTLVHNLAGPLSSRTFSIPPQHSGYPINRPFIIPAAVPVGYVYIQLTASANSVLSLEGGARATLFQLRGEKGDTGATGPAGDNTKFKISTNDTSEDFAINKIVGSTKVTITEENDGANETLKVQINDSTMNTFIAANSAVTANTAKTTNANHTGDVTGSGALTIANDAVTNTKAANMPASTIKGNDTVGSSDPKDLTVAETKILLGLDLVPNVDARPRSTHTGTQVASTISDFSAATAATASVTANTAKVTNATHTGDVTGSGALVIASSAITGKTSVTAASTDQILIADASDSNNLKRVTVASLGAATATTIGNTVISATVSTTTTGSGVISSMTTTPAAGTYLVSFSASMTHSNLDSDAFYWIESGGSIVTHSERNIGWGGGAATDDLEMATHTQAVVTVNGSQTVQVFWNRGSTGTFTCRERSMILLKVG